MQLEVYFQLLCPFILLEQVVEIGQVGRAADEIGQSAFYVHFQREARFGTAQELVNAFLRAGDDQVCLRNSHPAFCAQVQHGLHVQYLNQKLPPACIKICMDLWQAEVSEASGRNPGIPPSSLMSFLRVKPSIAGVVLGDFNTHFTNPFYQHRLDANISINAVTAAAIVSARALHDVAYGSLPVPQLKVCFLLASTWCRLEGHL